MQEQDAVPEKDPLQADERLAERLDRLTREEAERVLERALRLQSKGQSSETFTLEEIRLIATELGVEQSLVDRAVREALGSSGTADAGEGPGVIARRIVVSGAEGEVDDRVMAWMANEEGLRPVSRSPEGVTWEKDGHWMTSVRLVFGTEGTGALRGMKEVRHRRLPLGSDEHVVEIAADTSHVRWAGWGVGAGVTLLGLGGGAITAAAVPGGNDVVQFLSAAVPGLALAAGSAWATVRLWSSSVRRGVDSALNGIAHPDLHPRAERRRNRRS
ncbi:MAG: hypothetical protein ACLFWM_07575 [Actinomycetota bacterium]